MVNPRLLFTLLLVLAVRLTGMGQELTFRTYSISDGFPERGTSYPHSILKDKEGFVWFATYNGLARFDGEQFKRYTHDPDNPNSLGVNLLTVLAEDDYGRIWIGSATSGIYLYDKSIDSFFPLETREKKGSDFSYATTYFIEKDIHGNMWWGHPEGLRRWNIKDEIIDSFDNHFTHASAFLNSSNGTIWIADTNGLQRLRPGQQDFEKVLFHNQALIGKVGDLYELETGKILVSTTTGTTWEITPSEQHTLTLAPAHPTISEFSPAHFVQGLQGDLWMLKADAIMRFNQRSGSKDIYRHDPAKPLSLPASTLVDLMVDPSGNIFLQTLEDGIILANTHPHSFEEIGSFQAIEFLTLDSTKILIRDFQEGGIIYDTKNGKTLAEKIPTGPGTIYPPSMVLQGDSLLWILEKQRVKSYHLTTGEVRWTPPNPYNSLYLHLDHRGRIWNGLSYFDKSTNQWVNFFPELQKHFPHLDQVEYSYSPMHFDKNGNLWALIYDYYGFIRYNLETKTHKRYLLPANSFFQGTEGRFYVNSTEGCRIYQPELDSFLYLKNEDQLNITAIFYATEDLNDGSWLMTSTGLQRYDLNSGGIRKVDYEDGFPAIGQTVVRRSERDHNGYIYFDINMKKVVRFHPDSLPLNEEQSNVHILDFFLNGQVVKPHADSAILTQQVRFTEEIRLNHTQSDFGFRFTMPIFYKSKKIQYSYRLKPFQDTWQSNGQDNQINFTNIDPGQYTFEVKAQSASGVWSSNPASIKIVIRPPWWQTWWARLLFVLLLISVLYRGWRYELNRRLAQAKAERLQEVDNLKTKLYTNITHEFRTPLTVIMGMADNLKEEQQERHLIKRNSKNLLRLVNQLLDLSKLDSQTMKMQLVQGDFVKYLRYLTESFHSLAAEREIQLLFEPEVDHLTLDFDEVKIQHIIYNLLSNALKFTPSGGLVVLNIQRGLAGNTPVVILNVRDNGIGISETDQVHIFDRFYQADGSNTRKGEGTGIGLALTKELIHLMEGRISIKSRLGEGTQFTVEFPIKQNSTTPQLNTRLEIVKTSTNSQVHDRQEPEQAFPPSASDRAELLLIEDNKDVALYIETVLKADYSITKATNGQEGIDKALATIPDIIISDVMMPEKDGFEVCHLLKTDERTSHIPIILLTARAEQQDKLTGLQHGADAYLMKPFDKQELLIRLKQSLKLRQVLRDRYSSEKVYDYPSPEASTTSLEEEFLNRLRTAIEAQLDNAHFTIEELARAMQLSSIQLYRKVKALTGTTPTLFVRSYRLHRALKLLKTTSATISEIAYDTGFTSPAYFSRAFKEEFGQAPSMIRK